MLAASASADESSVSEYRSAADDTAAAIERIRVASTSPVLEVAACSPDTAPSVD
jgi:hypothetical protein